MMRLFLCDARRLTRSIVDLCEELGDRRTRAKRTHQNGFYFFSHNSVKIPCVLFG